MESKLTAKIAALYFGCEVQVNDNEQPQIVGAICGWLNDCICLEYEKSCIWVHVSYCQLLLTPLDKISDEVAIEVAKLVGFQEGLKGWGKWYCKVGFPHDCALSADKQLKIIDYLRSQSVDVDGLIEKGVALDKTTFNRSDDEMIVDGFKDTARIALDYAAKEAEKAHLDGQIQIINCVKQGFPEIAAREEWEKERMFGGERDYQYYLKGFELAVKRYNS